MLRVALTAIPAAVVALTAAAHREGAPPAHTGGFGEPTCVECHFDWEANEGPGRVALTAPAAWAPGETYTITVEVSDPDLVVAGFQLSARYDDGDARGRSAGTLHADTPAVRVVPAPTPAGDVLYAGHTEDGTEPAAQGRARWTVRWTAPSKGEPAGAVVFHAAANAANYDESPFGDRVYTTTARSDGGR